MPICISRHMTLRFFLMVRDIALSSGPKSSIEPVKSRASAPYLVENTAPGMDSSVRTPLVPLDKASHSFSGVLPSGEISPIPVITTRRDMQQQSEWQSGQSGRTLAASGRQVSIVFGVPARVEAV